MPKIKSFAPSWLNEPAPGHKLFEPPADDARPPAPLPYGKKPKPGPRRTIARRGTEVFVAVGKQIRWGDLAYLKESWEAKQARSGAGPRVKRESADASFDGHGHGGGTAESDHHAGALAEGGYRVSVLRWPRSLAPSSFVLLTPCRYRRSRRRSPTTSASWSCRRITTSSPS